MYISQLFRGNWKFFFRECVWNNHRTHKEKGKEVPTGVPKHIYFSFQKSEQCGFDIPGEQLVKVAELSNVLDHNNYYLVLAVCKECEKAFT